MKGFVAVLLLVGLAWAQTFQSRLTGALVPFSAHSEVVSREALSKRNPELSRYRLKCDPSLELLRWTNLGVDFQTLREATLEYLRQVGWSYKSLKTQGDEFLRREDFVARRGEQMVAGQWFYAQEDPGRPGLASLFLCSARPL